MPDRPRDCGESWLHARRPGLAPPLTRFIVVILVVAAVRLAALPLRGIEDVLTWKIWMIAASKSVATVYGVGGRPRVRGDLPWLHHSTTVDVPAQASDDSSAARSHLARSAAAT